MSVGFQRQCRLLICSCSCDRASITMITDSPHKANANGEIQLNQRTLDAIIRTSQPSFRSPLVGSVCQQRHNSDHRSFGWTGHIASGMQLAPSRSTGCWQPVAQPARTLPEPCRQVARLSYICLQGQHTFVFWLPRQVSLAGIHSRMNWWTQETKLSLVARILQQAEFMLSWTSCIHQS